MYENRLWTQCEKHSKSEMFRPESRGGTFFVGFCRKDAHRWWKKRHIYMKLWEEKRRMYSEEQKKYTVSQLSKKTLLPKGDRSATMG